ncbi:MAG: hypothetical protein IJV29_07565 [Butyrivibrio sp.]|nr:hypothetical protein [Butyrivibrio sp.]
MSAIKEIHYTICPVANASYIAANKGFLEEGLSRLGVKPVKLQTLSPENWGHHFNYEDDRLFREGGNTPPIWSKSRGAEPVLIGINPIEGEQVILVRQDSNIFEPKDLKGARLGIPVRDKVIIDHQQTSVRQGFQNVLEAFGISEDEVEYVELHDDEEQVFGGTGNWIYRVGPDIEALDRGEVDAVFVKLSSPERLLESGKYRKLIDLFKDQHKVYPVNNEYPNVLTVSKKLAEEEPEVVVEYVKQVILAARWAAGHKEEAEKLLAEQTNATVEQYRKAYPTNFFARLEPGFDDAALRTLDNRAKFLYDNGFLESRVDVYEWYDRSFLDKAIAELAEQSSDFEGSGIDLDYKAS